MRSSYAKPSVAIGSPSFTTTGARRRRIRPFGERFRRMWRFYILASAARFRARRNQLWQLVLSERGVLGGYAAVR